jgi:hypothetical protein
VVIGRVAGELLIYLGLLLILVTGIAAISGEPLLAAFVAGLAFWAVAFGVNGMTKEKP